MLGDPQVGGPKKNKGNTASKSTMVNNTAFIIEPEVIAFQAVILNIEISILFADLNIIF